MFSTKFRVVVSVVISVFTIAMTDVVITKYNKAKNVDKFNALYRDLDDRLVLMSLAKKGPDLESLSELMKVKNAIMSERATSSCIKQAASTLKTAAQLSTDSYIFAYANNSMHNSNILSALKKEDSDKYIEIINSKNAGSILRDLQFGNVKYPDSTPKELLFLLGAAKTKELLLDYNKQLKQCE